MYKGNMQMKTPKIKLNNKYWNVQTIKEAHEKTIKLVYVLLIFNILNIIVAGYINDMTLLTINLLPSTIITLTIITHNKYYQKKGETTQ